MLSEVCESKIFVDKDFVKGVLFRRKNVLDSIENAIVGKENSQVNPDHPLLLFGTFNNIQIYSAKNLFWAKGYFD